MLLLLAQFGGCSAPIPAQSKATGAGGAVADSTGGVTSNRAASNTGGTQTDGATEDGSANDCAGIFSPCGGDPTGTWDIASVCVDGDLAAAANQGYASDAAECSSLCTSATLAAAGSVSYDNGSLQPNAILSLTETWVMPANCYAALSGATWATSACASYAQGLNQQSGTTVTCSPGNALCDCVYSNVTPSTTDTYAVNGSLLVASDGSTTEFCIQGSTMTQRDSLGNSAYAVTQFNKRQ